MKNKNKNKQKTIQKEKIVLPEYYQIAFSVLNQIIFPNLSLEISNVRRDLYLSFLEITPPKKNHELSGQEAFDFLKSFSDHITKKLEEHISAHSVFYWLHLYRRIGVSLSTLDGEKRDPSTIALVRTIVETAVFRFGSLENKNDMVLSNQLSHHEVIGGFFAKGLAKFPDNKIEKLWKLYKPQWVIGNFTEQDLKNIYFIEAMAYEYWRVTAQMRAVGKGSKIKIDSKGIWQEKRDDDIANLIESYDRRINSALSYLPTAKGLASFLAPESAENIDSLIFVRYNVDRSLLKDELSLDPEYTNEEMITNFLPVVMNISNYIKSHRIFEQPFRSKWGFGFEEVLLFLQAISFYVFVRSGETHGDSSLTLLQVLQRGYTYTNSENSLALDLGEIITELQKNGVNYGGNITKELPLIITHFTLNASKQSSMSLWSYGPRPIIIPNGHGAFIDLVGYMIVLRNLFFGVKENQTKRGYEFEDVLRDETTQRGYHLLPDRLLHLDKVKGRETDLAIKIKDVLVLCDCRSIEKPVDFELGKIKTIEYRTRLLQEKVSQINSLKEFVTTNPKGKNYDFSWAKSIYSIAVSTETEWIWTQGGEAWIDISKDLPIIMNVEELFKFLNSLVKTES